MTNIGLLITQIIIDLAVANKAWTQITAYAHVHTQTGYLRPGQ
jgi:hypothetical protein